MNSRERLIKTINHQEPDCVVFDLGATSQTGIGASALYRLRQALDLPAQPVTIHEPAQLLGQVDDDLRQALGIDVVGLWNPMNVLGVLNDSWKPWMLPDHTPALISGNMGFKSDECGTIFAYPQGDLSVAPSMKLPAGGYFFDNIDRGGEFDEDELNAKEDFKNDFSVFDDETARKLETESIRLYQETNYGVVGMCGGGGFGDVFTLPACWLKETPHGIRKMEDWLMAHLLYQDYILDLFDMQAGIALRNLEIYRQAVGDRIQVIWLSGTDFGTQNGTFISAELYRKLYKPFHQRINDWVHKNTNWKTFYHTCGSIYPLLDDFAAAGIDILNPVQCSAKDMDPIKLKQQYGDKFVFWGGGINTQQTLPFGTPEEVRAEALERLAIFAPGGGYIFNAIHNIVGNVPTENLLAWIDALRIYRGK